MEFKVNLGNGLNHTFKKREEIESPNSNYNTHSNFQKSINNVLASLNKWFKANKLT
jgi:hypothetical protein